MPYFMKVNIRFVSPWFGRYPSKKEPCFPPEAKSWENWNHHCSCFLGAMSRQAKVGGGGIFTFPSLLYAWNNKMKVCGGSSATASGKCGL